MRVKFLSWSEKIARQYAYRVEEGQERCKLCYLPFAKHLAVKIYLLWHEAEVCNKCGSDYHFLVVDKPSQKKSQNGGCHEAHHL